MRRNAGWCRRTARGLRPRDTRELVIFLYTTAGMVFMFSLLSAQQDRNTASTVKFERQIAENCRQTNASNATFNAVLDQLTKNAQRSTALKPEQKKQAVEAYARLHLPITRCPPSR